MSYVCKNVKCDYYGGTQCFARRCKESCRNLQCVMFGEDHFAEMCRPKCECVDCLKFGQYHPPGELCFYRNTNNGYGQQNTSQSFRPEEQQMAANFYRQILSSVEQNHHMVDHFPNSMQQQTNNQYQPFNLLAGMTFSPFPPTMGSNNMPYSPNIGGWPFGQN